MNEPDTPRARDDREPTFYDDRLQLALKAARTWTKGAASRSDFFDGGERTLSTATACFVFGDRHRPISAGRVTRDIIGG